MLISHKAGKQLRLRVDPGRDQLRGSFERTWKILNRFEKRNLAISQRVSFFQTPCHCLRNVLLEPQRRPERKGKPLRQMPAQTSPR